MLDQELQIAIDNYQIAPSSSAATNLCNILLQNYELPSSELTLGGISQPGLVGYLNYGIAYLDLNGRMIIISDKTKGPIVCWAQAHGNPEKDIIYTLSRASRNDICAREDLNAVHLSRQINYALNVPGISAPLIQEVSEQDLGALCCEQYLTRFKLLLQYVRDNPSDGLAPILAVETYFRLLNGDSSAPISMEWTNLRLQLLNKREKYSVIRLGMFSLFFYGSKALAAFRTDTKECYHISQKLLRTGIWPKSQAIKAINEFFTYEASLQSIGKGNLTNFGCIEAQEELLKLLLS